MDIAFLEKTSAPAILDGDWVDNIPTLPGIKLKVKPRSSRMFKIELKKFEKDHADLRRKEFDVYLVRLNGLFADHLVTDWEGVTENGQPKPFTKDALRKILTFEGEDHYQVAAAFRDGVEYAVLEVTEALAKEAREASGNSPDGSDGQEPNAKPTSPSKS